MDRIERAIGKAVQPVLKEHGFELRKDWGYFVREQRYGHDAMFITNQGTTRVRRIGRALISAAHCAE